MWPINERKLQHAVGIRRYSSLIIINPSAYKLLMAYYRIGQKYLNKTYNYYDCQKSLLLLCEANELRYHFNLLFNMTSSNRCLKFCLNTSARLCITVVMYLYDLGILDWNVSKHSHNFAAMLVNFFKKIV